MLSHTEFLMILYFIICELLVIPEICSQVLLRMRSLNNRTKQQITLRNTSS